MITQLLPNTVTSNVCWPVIVALTTVGTMRVRNSLCTKQPRLRTQYAVELRQMTFVNFTAMASLILWCTVLPIDFSRLVALDIIVGLPMERWIIKVMLSFDPQAYHPGGPIGLAMINQRIRYGMLITVVLRGYIAATVVALSTLDSINPYVAPPMLIAGLPLVYTLVRTIILDVQMYQRSVFHAQSVAVEDTEFSISGPSGSDEDDGELDTTTAL